MRSQLYLLALLLITAVSASQVPNVTDAQIQQLTEDLLANDVNNVADEITINLQGRAPHNDDDDNASGKLLTVPNSALTGPTIVAFLKLLNNYKEDVTQAEDVTDNERVEEEGFLAAALATPVMNKTERWLKKEGFISNAPGAFRSYLRKVWFALYPRGGRVPSSSGFEHVFVGEYKGDNVLGLHNWIYFHLQEEKGRLDYTGYIRKISLGQKGTVLKVRIRWDGFDKPANSLIIGTSPELEMAVYTICFLARPDRSCRVKMGGSTFTIQTWGQNYRGQKMIGSAYPNI